MRALILDLWVVGQSSGQIAAVTGLTRNAVMGVVHRAGKRLEAETGTNPYRRPNHSLNTLNGLRHPGRVVRVKKVAKVAKPPQVKRVIDFTKVTPGDPLPPLVKLDERLWNALPGTEPRELVALSPQQCRWPISVGDSALFCAAPTCQGSYCSTHRRWSLSNKPLSPLNFGKAA